MFIQYKTEKTLIYNKMHIAQWFPWHRNLSMLPKKGRFDSVQVIIRLGSSYQWIWTKPESLIKNNHGTMWSLSEVTMQVSERGKYNLRGSPLLNPRLELTIIPTQNAMKTRRKTKWQHFRFSSIFCDGMYSALPPTIAPIGPNSLSRPIPPLYRTDLTFRFALLRYVLCVLAPKKKTNR